MLNAGSPVSTIVMLRDIVPCVQLTNNNDNYPEKLLNYPGMVNFECSHWLISRALIG